jgi:aspartate-semialdehyde dehydrogenase
MPKKFNVAIVGATGLVGLAMLAILEQRRFPIKNLYLLASPRSAGKVMSFNKLELQVEDLAEFDFQKADLALFSAGAAVSVQYVPLAVKNDCIVIDNTSQFRNDPNVPLIVPEVNLSELKNYKKSNIVANPNCSTIQMVVAIKPIYDAVGINRINVVTYQSVSGAGKAALHDLIEQSGRALNGLAIKNSKAFAAQIAFNVIPQIDEFQENAYTREEMKMVYETRKIFGDQAIQVNPTAVRVPVFYSHAEAVHLETKQKITATRAKQLLKKAPGVIVIDQLRNNGYPMPIMKNSYEDAIMVGRIREDISHPLGLNLWVVADNIRKGAALNAIQIAESLIKDYL